MATGYKNVAWSPATLSFSISRKMFGMLGFTSAITSLLTQQKVKVWLSRIYEIVTGGHIIILQGVSLATKWGDSYSMQIKMSQLIITATTDIC